MTFEKTGSRISITLLLFFYFMLFTGIIPTRAWSEGEETSPMFQETTNIEESTGSETQPENSAVNNFQNENHPSGETNPAGSNNPVTESGETNDEDSSLPEGYVSVTYKHIDCVRCGSPNTKCVPLTPADGPNIDSRHYCNDCGCIILVGNFTRQEGFVPDPSWTWPAPSGSNTNSNVAYIDFRQVKSSLSCAEFKRLLRGNCIHGLRDLLDAILLVKPARGNADYYDRRQNE